MFILKKLKNIDNMKNKIKHTHTHPKTKKTNTKVINFKKAKERQDPLVAVI